MKQKLKKLSIALALMAISAGAAAQTWNCGYPNEEDVTATLADGTLTISGEGAMRDYAPAIDGVFVPWGEFNSDITSVIIEEGVTSIGAQAFAGCNLTEIIIPDNVTSIGNWSFCYCSNLTAVTILGNASIGEGAFSYCDNLREVSMPNGVTSVGDYAFYESDGLEYIIIPNGIESIGKEVFDYSGLSVIKFEGDMPLLDIQTFYGVDNLTLLYPFGNPTWDDFTYPGVYIEQWGERVTFESNGGSEVAGQTVEYYEPVTRPADPVKTDCIFAGWYTDNETFTDKWDFTADVVNEDITLYAKWAFSQNTVTFNSNGGSEAAAQTVAYGENATEPAVTKTGYAFAGWYKEEALITPWDFTTDVVNEDITLYAKWTVVEPTAISATEQQALKLYSNPVTSGELTIESGELQAGEPIAVYNLSGAQVAVYKTAGEQTTINISQLPSGTYLVKAGNYVSKVVKE